MRPISSSVRAVPFAIALLSIASACSKDTPGAAAAAESNRGGAASQQGGPAGGAGGGAGAARGPGGAGGRPSPSITLAATDVATVAPMTIEDGIALTGDLHPIETIDVRARIEGDLQAVYVR